MWLAREKYRGAPMTCPVRIDMCYYFPNRKRRDILNDKLTYDALEGIIYADDKQISEAHIYKRYDRKNPRAELMISTNSDKEITQKRQPKIYS